MDLQNITMQVMGANPIQSSIVRDDQPIHPTSASIQVLDFWVLDTFFNKE
jgi:hypothetical protein